VALLYLKRGNIKRQRRERPRYAILGPNGNARPRLDPVNRRSSSRSLSLTAQDVSQKDRHRLQRSPSHSSNIMRKVLSKVRAV
jgi:hypothetical protein